MVNKIFLLLLGCCCFLACDPFLNPKYQVYWYIRNRTEKKLLLNFDNSISADKELKDSIYIKGYYVAHNRNEIVFHLLYSRSNFEDSVVFRSLTNDILKTWRESERDSSGRQFFNEKYWTKREYEEGRHVYIEWTFELLPEDIEQPESTTE